MRVRLLANILHDGTRLARGAVVDLPADRVADLSARGLVQAVASVTAASEPVTAPEQAPEQSSQTPQLPAEEKAEIEQAVETVEKGWASRSRRSKDA